MKQQIIKAVELSGYDINKFSILNNCTVQEAKSIIDCAVKLNRPDTINENGVLISAVCDKLQCNVSDLARLIGYQQSILANVQGGRRGLPKKYISLFESILKCSNKHELKNLLK
jgi:hypothetical protein